MQTSGITNTILVILVASLPGCAVQHARMDENSAGLSPDAVNLSEADPHLDHVFAWIPQAIAKTAAVAEALVHIELGHAKDDVGNELCGGEWLINGVSVASSGPYPSTAPAELGAYPAWYYHVSHKPGLAGCSSIPTERLYREIGNRLPPWITVRGAAMQVSKTSVTNVQSPAR